MQREKQLENQGEEKKTKRNRENKFSIIKNNYFIMFMPKKWCLRFHHFQIFSMLRFMDKKYIGEPIMESNKVISLQSGPGTEAYSGGGMGGGGWGGG